MNTPVFYDGSGVRLTAIQWTGRATCVCAVLICLAVAATLGTHVTLPDLRRLNPFASSSPASTDANRSAAPNLSQPVVTHEIAGNAHADVSGPATAVRARDDSAKAATDSGTAASKPANRTRLSGIVAKAPGRTAGSSVRSSPVRASSGKPGNSGQGRPAGSTTATPAKAEHPGPPSTPPGQAKKPTAKPDHPSSRPSTKPEKTARATKAAKSSGSLKPAKPSASDGRGKSNGRRAASVSSEP